MREGRILDVLIHTKVMQRRMHGPDDAVPAYSEDIVAAMEAVEVLRGRGYAFALIAAARGKGVWEAEFSPDGISGSTYATGVEGNTAPLAICLAARKIVEQA